MEITKEFLDTLVYKWPEGRGVIYHQDFNFILGELMGLSDLSKSFVSLYQLTKGLETKGVILRQRCVINAARFGGNPKTNLKAWGYVLNKRWLKENEYL